MQKRPQQSYVHYKKLGRSRVSFPSLWGIVQRLLGALVSLFDTPQCLWSAHFARSDVRAPSARDCVTPHNHKPSDEIGWDS